MESLWRDTVSLSSYKHLEGNIKVQAAVIGGGLAGLLTAYFLQRQGIECAVLEAGKICGGQTGNTTAKITIQHGLKYQHLVEMFDLDKAAQYFKANQEAIKSYENIIKEEKIECSFRKNNACLYAKDDPTPLYKEMKAAETLGIECDIVMESELPFPATVLRFFDQAEFHPLKFAEGIIKELTIYEHTPVSQIKENEITTPYGTVEADNIVIVTHFPIINSPGYYFLRQHQERSYVLALKNAPRLSDMYYGIEPDGLSFRSAGEYLLLGGGNHRTGENSAGGKYEMLESAAKKFYPKSETVYRWSAQDCMPLDGVPYIGQFSASTPHIFTATGFQKWGMTSSMAAAGIITTLIQGNPHPYPVFSPLRFTPSASAAAFAGEAAQSVKGLSRELLKLPKEKAEQLPVGHGGVVELDGKKIGVYKNENGEVFAVSVRCPHLGCQLEWNPDEKSWDCPCHGSRFDYRGNLIDNPAISDLEAFYS